MSFFVTVLLLLISNTTSFQPISDHRFDVKLTRVSSSSGVNEFPVEPLSPEQPLPGTSGNVHIPKTGISVSDEIEEANKDRYTTKLVPIKQVPGVAELISRPVLSQSVEPLRYLVALSPPRNDTATDYVMVDVPPFSTQLLGQMQAFMGTKGRLRAILITNRNAIHYDDAPAVYSIRRADLEKWKKFLPEVPVFGYRLEIPRDCRFAIDQVLDGYGPYALSEESNFTFVETGRPLSVSTWDDETMDKIMSGAMTPEEVADCNNSATDFSAERIREREEGRRILAIYTPGHSYGSLSFVFPEVGVCCSGFTIPCEDNRAEENRGSSTEPGPMLDYRGFVTTSQDQRRQFESAKSLIDTYCDRFRLVLPSQGDPLLLGGGMEERKEALHGIMSQFELLGEIYQQLGIVAEKDKQQSA